ncbi:MAG: helix-turn-helix domain-containing protein [Candidatus Omnitrophota bacterium]
MPEKLLTLKELSDYLEIKEDVVSSLVEDGVISAYKIGGELLRFRREQIDAIRSEIESRVTGADRIGPGEAGKVAKPEPVLAAEQDHSAAGDRVADFFYFNDFYIISAILIIALLMIIFKG